MLQCLTMYTRVCARRERPLGRCSQTSLDWLDGDRDGDWLPSCPVQPPQLYSGTLISCYKRLTGVEQSSCLLRSGMYTRTLSSTVWSLACPDQWQWLGSADCNPIELTTLLYNVLNSKFGAQCHRQDCFFQHPSGRVIDGTCMHTPSCHRP